MNLGRAALAYAAHGRPVFPLRPEAKAPITKHGVKDATTDAATLRAWWKRWPSANIGLAILANEVVIDVDVRSGGDQTVMQWFENHLSLPLSPTQRTPTAGEHLFFKRPASVDLVGKPKDAPGIDVLGKGKYVVAAPSRIKGREDPYAWTIRLSKTPLADMPSWLAEIVTRAKVTPIAKPRPPARTGSVIERAEKWLAKADPSIMYQGGSNTCFRVTSRLVRGFILDEATALDLLERIYNPKCAPPWSRAELKHKIKQAISCGNCAWGALLEQRRSA